GAAPGVVVFDEITTVLPGAKFASFLIASASACGIGPNSVEGMYAYVLPIAVVGSPDAGASVDRLVAPEGAFIASITGAALLLARDASHAASRLESTAPKLKIFVTSELPPVLPKYLSAAARPSPNLVTVVPGTLPVGKKLSAVGMIASVH